MNKVICSAAVLFVLVYLLLTVLPERPVQFEDVNLRNAVNRALGNPEYRSDWLARFLAILGVKADDEEYRPKPSDMAPLESLSAEKLNFLVLALGGIEYAPNLTKLEFSRQHISEVTAIGALANLRELRLGHNRIEDISALGGLANLVELGLSHNQISDISALADLRGLEHLNLEGNPLNKEAYDVHLPRIVANNPGMRLIVDANSSPGE